MGVEMASSGRGSERTTKAITYVPRSRIHRLKEMNGKSDQVTLASANKRNNARAELRAKTSGQLSCRAAKIHRARTISNRKTLRSRGLPSSNAVAAEVGIRPSHWAGDR